MGNDGTLVKALWQVVCYQFSRELYGLDMCNKLKCKSVYIQPSKLTLIDNVTMRAVARTIISMYTSMIHR